jgi:hypothetical protein
MFKFHRVVILVMLGMIWQGLSLTVHAETLKFAWPNGASAKVQARSEGRRVTSGRKQTWDMSCDFTMRVERSGDRVLVLRNGFFGWKGTLPPSYGGGVERFTDMIPTFIVSGGGAFIGIEGHEITRKLMNSSVEQSGGMDAMSRKAFETLTSDTALRAIASDHWSTLVPLWQDVELDPDASYELRNVTSVPQLGGGNIEITGAVRFVKETPCASGRVEQRCVHLHAETGADKAQVSKLIQSVIQRAGANDAKITAWDQGFKVDIVVEKATMLPQQLTITRFNAMNFRIEGQDSSGSEEITKTYTFAWLFPDAERKK